MTNRRLILVIIMVISGGLALPVIGQAATGVGFGVGIPVTTGNWADSFPYITVEAFTASNLAVRFTLGTYPNDFPTGFETSMSLLAKGWGGPVAVYAGGGLSVYWKWLTASSVWKWSPYMNLIAGVEWHVAAPLSLFAQVRALDSIPPAFALHPQASVGARLVFGPAVPHSQSIDGVTLWIIVGLGALALVAFLPRN